MPVFPPGQKMEVIFKIQYLSQFLTNSGPQYLILKRIDRATSIWC